MPRHFFRQKWQNHHFIFVLIHACQLKPYRRLSRGHFFGKMTNLQKLLWITSPSSLLINSYTAFWAGCQMLFLRFVKFICLTGALRMVICNYNGWGICKFLALIAVATFIITWKKWVCQVKRTRKNRSKAVNSTASGSLLSVLAWTVYCPLEPRIAFMIHRTNLQKH